MAGRVGLVAAFVGDVALAHGFHRDLVAGIGTWMVGGRLLWLKAGAIDIEPQAVRKAAAETAPSTATERVVCMEVLLGL
jgi:hypothetical protein